MRILLSMLIILFLSTNVLSQQKKNIIWFTEKSATATKGFKEGQTVPNLSLKDVYMKRTKLHDNLDKLTIIDFRNTNCQSCTKNIKFLKKFYQQYAINIISIYDDTRAVAVKKFANKNGMNWKNVQDDAIPRELLKKQLGLTKDDTAYIIISPNKKVLKVFNNRKGIGMMGVFLQQYFANK